ncbi:MAG: type II toxin-antitoxin system death-on-curing family toxin [Pirellulales bacterium]|nr:type II toxin-antitoxin system death-on-curing family toxin [Pirellulales bacterium]
MQEPVWINEPLALSIHKRQLAEHGGIEGIRDEGLLASALARPQHLLAYSPKPPHVAQLAAAYAYGIAKNHPFLDGNKRTAAVVCETFVDLNGYQLTADDQSMCMVFLKLAEGNLSEEELVAWLKEYLVKEE